MKYILLIYSQAGGDPDPAMRGRHATFAQEVGRRGLLVDGYELDDPAVATTIRPSGEDLLITDGPYSETKEHLAGFYLIDCADLDVALEVARGVPLAAGGTVEVRPVLER